MFIKERAEIRYLVEKKINLEIRIASSCPLPDWH